MAFTWEKLTNSNQRMPKKMPKKQQENVELDMFTVSDIKVLFV